jgi:hypothetical protein
MNARYSLPVLVGLAVTGISAAYLVYFLLRKVRVVVTGLQLSSSYDSPE